MAKKPAAPAKKAPVRKKPAKAKDSLQLSEVRAQIDGLDRQIQDLITQRATWAQKVRAAKGELKAAVEYYRPERESQILRRVLDRNQGPLSNEVLLQAVPRDHVGMSGPAGTFEGRFSRPGRNLLAAGAV